jgi:hypothetical protein
MYEENSSITAGNIDLIDANFGVKALEVYVNAFAREQESFNGAGYLTIHADYLKTIFTVLSKYDYTNFATTIIEKLSTGKGNDIKVAAKLLSKKATYIKDVVNDKLINGTESEKQFVKLISLNYKTKVEEKVVHTAIDEKNSENKADMTVEEKRDVLIEKIVDEITDDYGDSDAKSEWEHIHFCMSYYNWDGGMEFPEALIDHPNCDKGTALLIFWYMSPSFYVQYPKEKLDKPELENFAFLKKIVQKFVNNDFKTEKIKFDPKNDNGKDWTVDALKINNNSVWIIPEIMFDATQGRTVCGADCE